MNELEALIREQFSNQFLSGGLILSVFIGLMTALRKVPGYLWIWVKGRLIVTVDIADQDQAFYWIQTWLGKQEYTRSRARVLTLTTRTAPAGHDAPKSIESGRRGRVDIDVFFTPAPGFHLFKYKGSFILLQRIRTEAKTTSSYASYHETMVLQTFSRGVIESLVRDAKEATFPIDDERVAIFRSNYHGWRMTQLRLPRSLESVILDEGILQNLKNDLTRFMGSAGWYAKHGIPYQRGYMLCGPPGNGKTSIVVALASFFKRDIYIMNVAGMTDNGINNQMAELPEHAFLLIEDIDRAFIGRTKTEDADERLSFSGLLNAIDGVSAPTGRILFMTTNHPELLDEALLRPGRADRQIVFTNAFPEMGKSMFLRFFPEKPGLAESFAEAIECLPVEKSMAKLQELLIKHLDDPRFAIEELRDESKGQASNSIRVKRLD